MKPIRSALVSLSLLSALAASAEAVTLSANLVGSATTDTDGTGFATVEIVGDQVSYTLLVNGIATATAAHIHRASDSQVVVGFTAPSSGSSSGTVTASSLELAKAISGNPSGYYVNVHNADFPGGAIRGTLAAAGDGVSTESELWFPVVSSAPGANGTTFKTDLTLSNPGTTAADVVLTYVKANGGGETGPTATATVSVPAGGQLTLADVVHGTLGRTNERGALMLETSEHVDAQARIYNDQRGTSNPLPGTFSQYSRAVRPEDIPMSGTLLGLSDVPASTGRDFRTNLVYANPGTSTVHLTLVAHRENGTVLGTDTLDIPGMANGVQPVFAMISSVAASERQQAGFFVTYSASAPILLDASVVDNVTGDAILVTPFANED